MSIYDSTTNFSGVPAKNIAKWNGTEWNDIGTFASGELIVSGNFIIGSEGVDFDFGETKYSCASIRDGVLQYGIPASTPCPYCGTHGGEDKYHSGTCANCGAVL